MKNDRKKKDKNKEVIEKGVEIVLQEAKIVARWAKKPFYIS